MGVKSEEIFKLVDEFKGNIVIKSKLDILFNFNYMFLFRFMLLVSSEWKINIFVL